MEILKKISKDKLIIMVTHNGELAEKYAKSTNTACVFIGILHQPKMPKALIKED